MAKGRKNLCTTAPCMATATTKELRAYFADQQPTPPSPASSVGDQPTYGYHTRRDPSSAQNSCAGGLGSCFGDQSQWPSATTRSPSMSTAMPRQPWQPGDNKASLRAHPGSEVEDPLSAFASPMLQQQPRHKEYIIIEIGIPCPYPVPVYLHWAEAPPPHPGDFYGYDAGAQQGSDTAAPPTTPSEHHEQAQHTCEQVLAHLLAPQPTQVDQGLTTRPALLTSSECIHVRAHLCAESETRASRPVTGAMNCCTQGHTPQW